MNQLRTVMVWLLLLPGQALAQGALAAVTEQATFAGGCFWCMESEFQELPGVLSVVSGFTGGRKQNPTYEEVSAGGTGHTESILITYEPAKISYARLLDVFWRNIDPTDKGGQFCDRGSQYRSGIFVHSPEQKKLAEDSKQRLIASQKLPAVYTPIDPATRFWPAEDYHQDYYSRNPIRYNYYRYGCGRDRRLEELWGRSAKH